MNRMILALALIAAVAVGGYWLVRGAEHGPAQPETVAAPTAAVAPAAAMHGEPAAAAGEGAAEDPPTVHAMVVHKSPTCGCCGEWVEHLEANGFTTQVENTVDLNPVKDRLGVPLALRSCHTAVADGYVFEGHIPADVIAKFLEERPEGALGLAVPGMPIGSPGMEVPLRGAQPYDVYLFDADGNARIYASR